MSKGNRPNILYIFTDEQSAAAMSCAGNTDLHTPAMDRLAAQGIRFEQAYTTYPLCVPARASMFTGCMPHEIGMNTNHPANPELMHQRSMAHALAQAGYECAYGGSGTRQK